MDDFELPQVPKMPVYVDGHLEEREYEVNVGAKDFPFAPRQLPKLSAGEEVIWTISGACHIVKTRSY